MHSFLVQSSNLPAGRQGVKVQSNSDTLIIEAETSIGIEEVRQIQHFLSRKPLGEKNTIYIRDAHLMTLPAQNALLKTLEEPPANAEIYLITAQPDLLLPTVLSRVQIEKPIDSPSATGDLADTKKLVEKILRAKVGERIAIVDELALTRDSALELLDKFEQLLHQVILNEVKDPENQVWILPPQSGARMTDLILETRKYLKANVNVKLAMDNLFIRLT